MSRQVYENIPHICTKGVVRVDGISNASRSQEPSRHIFRESSRAEWREPADLEEKLFRSVTSGDSTSLDWYSRRAGEREEST